MRFGQYHKSQVQQLIHKKSSSFCQLTCKDATTNIIRRIHIIFIIFLWNVPWLTSNIAIAKTHALLNTSIVKFLILGISCIFVETSISWNCGTIFSYSRLQRFSLTNKHFTTCIRGIFLNLASDWYFFFFVSSVIASWLK